MKILIGESASLLPNTSVSIDTGEMRIAVFRSAAGELHALEDRCPHRGARLSEGVVYEGYVACRDHGWSICLADGLVVPPMRVVCEVSRFRSPATLSLWRFKASRP